MRSALLPIVAVGAVVGLLACRKPGPPSATRWQYHTWSDSGRGTEARLDSLGAEGWELVKTVMYSSTPTLYFKRPLP